MNLTGRTPATRASRVDALRPGELTQLMRADGQRSGRVRVGCRCLPLEDRRWAIGRGTSSGVIWRIADEEVLRKAGHPAWLWTVDGFWISDGKEGRGDIPVVLPLRHVMRNCSSLANSRRQTIKTVASAIGDFRKGRQSVAIVVPKEALTSASQPAMWFGLAILTIVPPSTRDRLRISTFEASPNPGDWDIVLTDDEPGEGFDVIYATDPPDERGDLVSYFVRNRLHAGDPEAVEAAAFYADNDGPDPWGDGIKEHLKTGVPGVSVVDEDMLDRDPEGSVRALVARLRAGAPVDADIANQLALVTARTGDPRPWRALVSRSAVERAQAVQAWLPMAQRSKPRMELLRIVAALYPRGAPVALWYEALLAWYRAGVAQEAVYDLLEKSLLESTVAAATITQTSVWTEVVHTLVAQERYDEAVDAVFGLVGQSLVKSGLPSALAWWWALIPSRHRPLDKLDQLIDVFLATEGGDEAAALLYEHLNASHAQTRIDRLLSRWHEGWSERGIEITNERDALIEALRQTHRIGDWLRTVALSVPPEHVALVVNPFMTGEADEGWAEVEAAHGMALALEPRSRLLALRHLLPAGRVALEPVARTIIADAISTCTFPDGELADVAETFTEVPVASALWMWVAIASGPPERYDDETIDATVVAFCEYPPQDELDRMTAIRAAEALGLASAWNAIEHARWVVRLSLAPDPEETAFNFELALGVLKGISQVNDGNQRLADMTQALVELPEDHPALVAFLEILLPSLWPKRASPGYTKLVDDSGWNAMVRSRWRAAVK